MCVLLTFHKQPLMWKSVYRKSGLGKKKKEGWFLSDLIESNCIKILIRKEILSCGSHLEKYA